MEGRPRQSQPQDSKRHRRRALHPFKGLRDFRDGARPARVLEGPEPGHFDHGPGLGKRQDRPQLPVQRHQRAEREGGPGAVGDLLGGRGCDHFEAHQAARPYHDYNRVAHCWVGVLLQGSARDGGGGGSRHVDHAHQHWGAHDFAPFVFRNRGPRVRQRAANEPVLETHVFSLDEHGGGHLPNHRLRRLFDGDGGEASAGRDFGGRHHHPHHPHPQHRRHPQPTHHLPLCAHARKNELVLPGHSLDGGGKVRRHDENALLGALLLCPVPGGLVHDLPGVRLFLHGGQVLVAPHVVHPRPDRRQHHAGEPGAHDVRDLLPRDDDAHLLRELPVRQRVQGRRRGVSGLARVPQSPKPVQRDLRRDPPPVRPARGHQSVQHLARLPLDAELHAAEAGAGGEALRVPLRHAQRGPIRGLLWKEHRAWDLPPVPGELQLRHESERAAFYRVRH
mmetsp:Transcript_40806/g.75557  ORF Transcript_40806/g.75557 Transcript_40806/m.75557 type:complete len:448 (+) Transcript_40806:969-2312(+)